MSEDYIKNHFNDVKQYANVIENRLDDECTIEELIHDNLINLELAKKYHVDYILMDDKYHINLDIL